MTRFAGFSCLRCGSLYPADTAFDARGCPTCFDTCPSNLRAVYAPSPTRRAKRPRAGHQALPSLWRYADRLPFDEAAAVSLGEGLTPLVPVRTIGASLGVADLFAKDEGANPTWSHKDRFSTVAVSAARRLGAEVVATSSSGNAGASLAAYAARAGLSCVVSTFAGASGAMVGQIRKYGARVVSFTHKSDRWSFIADGVARFGWFATSPFRAPVVGSHPLGIEGYKTLAYEIVEQLGGEPPDWVALPVCYGDALAGLWQGFKDLAVHGGIDRLPRLVAAEVHGSLAEALARGGDRVPDVPAAVDTLAVSIGTTRSAFQALQALRESDGIAVPVGNDGLIALQEWLAAREGIFAELASVTPFAAIAQLRRESVMMARDRVVAIVTASGLKDLDRSLDGAAPRPVFDAAVDAWAHILGEGELGLGATSSAVPRTPELS